MILIERVLDDVVVPLAKGGPVLLLVLDGMSYAVFRQLLRDVCRLGWQEMTPEPDGRRLSAVAAFPSCTEVSRASLLAGRVTAGASADEKRSFESHEGLRSASKGTKAPALFHKAEVSVGGAYGLPEELGEALGLRGPRVVGLVLNAVDDHLGKVEQSAPRWSVEAIRPLHAVLTTALAARRRLVVTSDHGHVTERGTELRRYAGSGERHRLAVPAAGKDEVLVHGPRVVLDGIAGASVVMPWSERVRFVDRKNGYHGGASPQELVVPVAVFTPDEVPAGWTEMAVETPDWWDLEVAPLVATGPKASLRSPARVPPALAQPDLFTPPPAALADRLLRSERWADQLALAGRVRPEEADVRSILGALTASQGTLTLAALAKRTSTPPTRLELKLGALRKALNVDGYPVLEVEDETVRLNEALLLEQFLGEA